jgi:hypothetical protein
MTKIPDNQNAKSNASGQESMLHLSTGPAKVLRVWVAKVNGNP